jgi:hypothetical protein
MSRSSLALAVGALAVGILVTPGLAQAKTVSIVCKGGTSSCKAVLGVAGGASREKVKITLSDTDLKLRRVVAKPGSIKGAYALSHGSYSLGGSLYTVTLNAVQSIPRGATLTFTFAVPPQRSK